jgi:hypothetical protein
MGGIGKSDARRRFFLGTSVKALRLGKADGPGYTPGAHLPRAHADVERPAAKAVEEDAPRRRHGDVVHHDLWLDQIGLDWIGLDSQGAGRQP